jgi:hypothetical protein
MTNITIRLSKQSTLVGQKPPFIDFSQGIVTSDPPDLPAAGGEGITSYGL